MKTKHEFDTLIKAETILFFDMDGTLIDTNYANFLSYKKAIISVTKSDHDLTYNPDRRFTRSVLKNAVPNLTENEYIRIIQEKEKYYTNYLHETKLITKNIEILFKYSKTNKTVLVTNSRRDRLMATIRHFGLEDKFSAIFCKEINENNSKINKFQNALSKLGVPPNLIVAFDNEETEILYATLSGIPIKNIFRI